MAESPAALHRMVNTPAVRFDFRDQMPAETIPMVEDVQGSMPAESRSARIGKWIWRIAGVIAVLVVIYIFVWFGLNLGLQN